jgi:hypothetical protein
MKRKQFKNTEAIMARVELKMFNAEIKGKRIEAMKLTLVVIVILSLIGLLVISK